MALVHDNPQPVNIKKRAVFSFTWQIIFKIVAHLVVILRDVGIVPLFPAVTQSICASYYNLEKIQEGGGGERNRRSFIHKHEGEHFILHRVNRDIVGG